MDVEIRFTIFKQFLTSVIQKKNKKNMKRMSKSVSHFPETDLDICFTEKKIQNQS